VEDSLDVTENKDAANEYATSRSRDSSRKKKHSEPPLELYKAAVLALLTDWVEEEYDSFVKGLNTFDYEPNVQKRLQLIQDKYLPQKTLDELNAINETIEQQANARRRKRIRLDDDRSSSTDDLFASDMMGLHHRGDTFSSGEFATSTMTERGGESVESMRRTLMRGRPLEPSTTQAMGHGRRASLPAFPVSRSFYNYSGYSHHQRHHEEPEQASAHGYYFPPSTQSAAAPSLSDSVDSAFSNFSQITRHAPANFAIPLSPPSAITGRRMSTPHIAESFAIKQELNGMGTRSRYSLQFDSTSHQDPSTYTEPQHSAVDAQPAELSDHPQHNSPMSTERRPSLHLDPSEYRSVDYRSQAQNGRYLEHQASQSNATVYQQRRSNEFDFHRSLEQGNAGQAQRRPSMDTYPAQHHSDSQASSGNMQQQQEQATGGGSTYGEETMPHTWSSRILEMNSAGEQAPEDYNLPPAEDSSNLALS